MQLTFKKVFFFESLEFQFNQSVNFFQLVGGNLPTGFLCRLFYSVSWSNLTQTPGRCISDVQKSSVLAIAEAGTEHITD